MANEAVVVKKYVVRLSNTEREELDTIVRTGKRSARQITKARILLKADVSETGPGWSDSQIATALEISEDTVSRTRQRLVEEGMDAVLNGKHSSNSGKACPRA
jgi:Homeodomain-like domain